MAQKPKKPSGIASVIRKGSKRLAAALPFAALLAEQQAHADEVKDPALAQALKNMAPVDAGGMMASGTGQEAPVDTPISDAGADVDVSGIVADAGVPSDVAAGGGNFDFELTGMELSNNFDSGNQGFFHEAAASAGASASAANAATVATSTATEAAAASASVASDAGFAGLTSASGGLTALGAAAAVGGAVVVGSVASHAQSGGSDHTFHSNGTHVSTSLTSMQAMGVTSVQADGVVGGISSTGGSNALHVDFGTGHLDSNGSIPVFDKDLMVTLNVHDSAQFAEAVKFDLAGMNVDVLNIDTTTGAPAVLTDAMFAGTAGQLGSALIANLQTAGLKEVDIASKSVVTLSDDLSAALHDAGMLHAVADANVTIDARANTNAAMNTTLKAMGDLGVDAVQTNGKVYVDLGANASEVTDILKNLGAEGTATPKLFTNDAGLVVDQATYDSFKAMDAASVKTMLAELNKLGITELDVVDSATKQVTTAYDIKAQVDLTHTVAVQPIGADATAIHDAFLHDVHLHK